MLLDYLLYSNQTQQPLPRLLIPLIITIFLGFNVPVVYADTCGNGYCAPTEDEASCPVDCDEKTCDVTYTVGEAECVAAGWTMQTVNVDGITREILWKAPAGGGPWNGAIITLHGGSGSYTNFCYAQPGGTLGLQVLYGQPMVNFAIGALWEGYAVFSLDSSFNRVTDALGYPAGKRWDSSWMPGTTSIDVAFIEEVIDAFIPSQRPVGSSDDIFLAGLSNGGYLATLAGTQLSDKVRAFAPVSSGNPYTTYIDMSYPVDGRPCAPGGFYDADSDLEITHPFACTIIGGTNDIPPAVSSTTFKQFYYETDPINTVTCSEKPTTFLLDSGYENAGAFTLGDRADWPGITLTHWWQFEYIQPMIDFIVSFQDPGIPSDFNNDGIVDIFDYNILIGEFGTISDCDAVADANGDCNVDIFDYNILLIEFGMEG